MKKVAIIELAAHAEVARAYVAMFLDSGYLVSLFTTQENFVQLNNLYSNNIAINFFVQESESSNSFISKNINIINECQLAIVCTPESLDGQLIIKSWNIKSYLVIHDANNYFNCKNHINFQGGIKQYLKIVKYFVTAYFSKRQKALATFDEVIVPSQNMAAYISKYYKDKKVRSLPFVYNEYSTPILDNKETTIVIPGTIGQRSRDYIFVCQLFRKMFQEGFSEKIKLVLLGQIKDKSIIEELKKLPESLFSLVVFEVPISQQVFDEEVSKADFFLLPLQTQWQYGIVNEVGGLTCLSGNIGDMVRYGMPAVLPNTYRLDEGLQGFVTLYKNNLNDATAMLKNYIVEKKFNAVKLDIKNLSSTWNASIKTSIKSIE